MFRIILFIILVIIIIIVISSLGYKDDPTPISKGKIYEDRKESLTSIHPQLMHGCLVYDIQDLSSKDAYIFSGNFDSSVLSIYKDDIKIYSDIINGDKSCIISSNQIIISSIARFIKNKLNVIGLEPGQKYRVIINNANDFNIKHYYVNYEIENKVLNFISKNIGFNEYDIFSELNKKYPNISRVFLKTTNKENKWSMKDNGRHVIVMINNINNLTIDINNLNHSTYKNGLNPEVKIIEILDPDVTVYNNDYKTKIKDINQEYLDFINGPNYLILKFLYGSDKRVIDYTSQVNNKVFIYKVIE